MLACTPGVTAGYDVERNQCIAKPLNHSRIRVLTSPVGAIRDHNDRAISRLRNHVTEGLQDRIVQPGSSLESHIRPPDHRVQPFRRRRILDGAFDVKRVLVDRNPVFGLLILETLGNRRAHLADLAD